MSVLLTLCSKDDHYPKKDGLSFNMCSTGTFYLMVNQILINAEDKMGFQQNMERLSFEEQFSSIDIPPVKLIFGEDPLHTPRKNRFVGNLPYRRIWEDIEIEIQRYEN